MSTRRPLIVLVGLILAGCSIAPAPKTSVTAPTPPGPAAQATLPPISAAPIEAGWTVVFTYDVSGDSAVISVMHRVLPDARLQIAYACGDRTGMTLRVIDATTPPSPSGEADDRTVVEETAECSPSIGSFDAPGPGRLTSLGLEVSVQSRTRYWAVVAVPDRFVEH